MGRIAALGRAGTSELNQMRYLLQIEPTEIAVATDEPRSNDRRDHPLKRASSLKHLLSPGAAMAPHAGGRGTPLVQMD